MAETSAAGVSGTERLHEYWVHGEGAAKIRWGAPGDYDRCVLHLSKYVDDAHGYCAQAHHDALGIWPATHAKELKGRSGMADAPKPYGDVKYADPKNGKYPVDTAEHAKAAWSYINMPKNSGQYPMNGVTLSEVKDRIQAACKKFGIETSDGDSPADSGRAESLTAYTRNVPVPDLSIRSAREGKIVTAYMARFNTPAEIHDQDGDYIEELDPVVFNKAISDARPQGNRKSWRTGVFYNHGLTIMGTPSDRHSMPVGVPLDIKADGDGVITETQYHRSEFAEEIVEGLESGAIPGYSFSGRFLRSSPVIPRGGFRARRDGSLPTVRRTESTLREYGPTPFPAYKEAAVLGMRAETLLASMVADPDLAMRMLNMFRDGTPAEEPPSPTCTPPDEEPQPRSRIIVHSGRSIREQILANAAGLIQGQQRS